MSDTDKETTTTAPQGRAPAGSPLVIVLVAVIAVLAVVVGYLVWERGGSPESGASSAPSAPAPESASPEPTSAPAVTDPKILELVRSLPKRDPADAQAKGKVDAPVVMVVYSDFACPYCTQFAQKVEPELADLVAQGTLRVEWRDLAQISPTSPLAAQAGRAAAKQGKFWEFHDAVYAAADPQGHPEYTEDSLVAFAKKAGVADIDRFRTDMNAAETVSAVTEAKEHAHSIGITGTPFMIVGETFISGYQDAEYMKAVINSQAAKVKTSDTSKTSAAPTATR